MSQTREDVPVGKQGMKEIQRDAESKFQVPDPM